MHETEVYKKIRDNTFQFLLDKSVRHGLKVKGIENVIVLVLFALVIQIVIDGAWRKEDRGRKVIADEACINNIVALVKRDMRVKISVDGTYFAIDVQALMEMMVKALHECVVVSVEHGMKSSIVVFHEIILDRRPLAKLLDTIQFGANNNNRAIHDGGYFILSSADVSILLVIIYWLFSRWK